MSTDSEEEARSDSSDEDNDDRFNKSHHNNSHLQSNNQSYLSSRIYENDNPDDLFNRERDNESKISTQRSKVSKNTLINHELLKSSRLSTLVSAVSTSNLVTSSSTSNTNDKLKRIKNKDSDEKSSESLNAKNNDTSASEQANALNLLKQIKQHQVSVANQNHSTTRKSNNSASNNNNSRTNFTSNKDSVEPTDEISENNLSKLTIAVLKLLNQLEIKFPGKNNDQTKLLISTIYSKLETYKPKLANYWMIKLDDSKRSKVSKINCT